MGVSNGQVLAELRHVRLRQIPWFRHAISFSRNYVHWTWSQPPTNELPPLLVAPM